MALRIFRSNPALGGFGGGPSSSAASESDPIADGDAFAQILKELVDNAVDACSVADSMSPALKSSSVEKRVRVTIESISNKDDDDTSVDSMELLRITVIDNGVGMKNIQQCVNPFHSTKQQQALRVTSNNDSDDASQSSETQESQEEGQTVGRYGIGLTLCFLHGQRLVANTSSQITSATAASSHWTNTLWVVDPDDDTVKCVKQWHIDKVGEDVVSGTKVSLVLPGGDTAERAWVRLEEYFRRFHLSVDLKCTLEVLAPSLSRVPVLIQPPNSGKDDVEDDGSGSESSQPIQELASMHGRLMAICHGAQKYLGQAVELRNAAFSHVPIRTSTSEPVDPTGPCLEITFIVVPPDDDKHGDDQDAELGSDGDSNSDNESDGAQEVPHRGVVRLIRMVNGIPMLDTAEALGCGVVNRIASLRQVWLSFGLEADLSCQSQDEVTNPTLLVRDSDQVLPYFVQGSHELFEASEESDDQTSVSTIDNGFDSDDSIPGRRRRRGPRADKIRALQPARVRFAKTLMVVHFHGKPSTLPLPTLSKGRLPVGDKDIDAAVELGLSRSLRMLQRTNPALLLSANLLQSSERDARYVPRLAAAVTSIVRNFESRSNKAIKATIRSWKPTDSGSSGSSTASDLSDRESEDKSDNDDSTCQDPKEEASLLASYAELQIRRRLEQGKVVDDKSDANSQKSESTDDSGPASKKVYQDLLNLSDIDQDSVESSRSVKSILVDADAKTEDDETVDADNENGGVKYFDEDDDWI